MDLSDDLALPLTSGVGFWYWLGGRPSFDFVNTHRERWWRNVETLVVPSDLSAWLVEAKLIDTPVPVTVTQLRAARRLRDALDAAILAAIDHRPPPQRSLDEINRSLTTSPAGLELISEDGEVQVRSRAPDDPIQHALHLIAHDAATVIGSESRDRARVCASETCSARFFDASRAGTRRWCSMSGCGNTAKARRHRARITPT